MPFFPSLPDDASTAEILLGDPDYFGPFVEFSEIVMRGPSELTPGEREMIGGYVSGLNECAYCAGGHQAAAAEFGIDIGVFEELMEDVDTASVDDKMKPILRFVRKLTLAPAKLIQADADAVFNAGWSEKALRDAICVACNFNFMNRLVKGHGIQADAAKFIERGRHHAEKGYGMQFRKLAPSSGGG